MDSGEKNGLWIQYRDHSCKKPFLEIVWTCAHSNGLNQDEVV